MASLGGLPDVVFDVPAVPTIGFDPPKPAPDMVVLPVAGPPGPPGASLSQIPSIAGATLSGHRVVRAQLDGTVVYASSTMISDVTRDLFLTLTAAPAGTAVLLQVFGQVSEPSWNWLDAPIFLTSAGVLTQIPPTPADGSLFIRQVAYPLSPTSLFFNPRTPIGL